MLTALAVARPDAGRQRPRPAAQSLPRRNRRGNGWRGCRSAFRSDRWNPVRALRCWESCSTACGSSPRSAPKWRSIGTRGGAYWATVSLGARSPARWRAECSRSTSLRPRGHKSCRCSVAKCSSDSNGSSSPSRRCASEWSSRFTDPPLGSSAVPRRRAPPYLAIW